MEDVLLWVEPAFRPVIAIVLAAVLGVDRSLKDRPAGLRTHMLVALGSASFTLAALAVTSMLQPGGASQGDPSRVIQGIVGGIGFLGAGSIIRSGESVQGITTAATIWVVGAIGVACGVGSYGIAATTTLLAFLTLTVLAYVENKIERWRRP